MRRPSRYTAPEFSDRNYRPARGVMPDDWREPDSEPSPEEEDSPEEPVALSARPGDDSRPRPRKRTGLRLGQFFTGSILSRDEFTRRLPVIVYIVFLMLLYIANGFHIQHKHNELDRISEELKHLKTRAVTSSAVRMTLTRQSEIERLLREHRIPLLLDHTSPHTIDE